ncbi:unnamed protein product, partial [Rotaria socialis]
NPKLQPRLKTIGFGYHPLVEYGQRFEMITYPSVMKTI